MTNSRHYTGNI